MGGSGSARHASRAILATLALALAAVVPLACDGAADQGALTTGASSTSGGAGGDDAFDAGLVDGPPPADAGGLCGNQIHPVVTRAPNLYFVLDASGSMATDAGNGTRYDAVRVSATNLVRGLGPFINVGAAVFPLHATAADSCHVGGEVFPISPGDPIAATDGATTTGFAKATGVAPNGGTPTAATLRALLPKLSLVAGKTVVLLATDGGPNCNAQASCSAADCITNIEGICDQGTNCCAPNGPDGPFECLDRQPSIDAVADLWAAGIATYVIGIPGSEVYADVLDAMALAGGAARPTEPRYYRVDDLAALGGVLSSIASEVVSCDFDVEDAPPDPKMTNVYLDQDVVPYDPVDGWVWVTPTRVELRGAACDAVKKGKVAQVQIVSGCPTEQPK